MRFFVEPSGLKLADNSITDALISKKWGIRVTFIDEQHQCKYSTILTIEELQQLHDDINICLRQIDSIK